MTNKKMTSAFLRISQAECAVVFPQILANSNDHYSISYLLSENGYYGAAISHLVLGAEELIKSMILFIESKGFCLRNIKGVKKLFCEHPPRHTISTMLQLFSFFAPQFIKFAERAKRITLGQVKANVLTDLENAMYSGDEQRTQELMEEKIARWFKNEIEPIMSFWDFPDEKKQQGFYADYQFHLTTPQQFSKKEYENALIGAEKFKDSCMGIMNYLDNIPDLELQWLIKKTNNDQRFRSMIQDMIFGTMK